MAGRDFVVIGENIHATRVLLKKSERISADEEGEESIVFVDEDGETRHLRIPEEEKNSQSYQEGRIKHVRLAVQIAMAGVEPDCSTALSYLSTLARRQVKAGAHFLDVNLDEISNKLADQLEAMRWLVRTLAHSHSTASEAVSYMTPSFCVRDAQSRQTPVSASSCANGSEAKLNEEEP
jgi:hypothetical protein